MKVFNRKSAVIIIVCGVLTLALLGNAPVAQRNKTSGLAKRYHENDLMLSELQTTQLPPFDEWMQDAEILLYEEIAGDYTRGRWIVLALENLGLSYFDTADAKGNFQYELTGSKVWDLIIYAREYRTNQSGNLFVAL